MHNYVTAQESLTLFLSHNKLTNDNVSYFLINQSKTKTFIDLTVTRKPVRSLKSTKNRTRPNRNEIPTHFIHAIKKKGYDRIGVTVFLRQKGVNFIPPILLISAVQSFKSVLLYCYRNETTGEHALYVIKFNCLLTISVYLNLMISTCFNWANLCILAKILSYLQGLITISLKAINSTLTIQEIPRPTVYRIVVQTLRSPRPFFKGLSFLIHLTTRSSTLNPFPLLRKN